MQKKAIPKMNNHSNESKSINRRKFLITIGNTVIGIIGAGTLGVTYKFLWPNVLKEIPPTFQVGSPEILQLNSFIFNEEYKVFIVRNELGQFYAISTVCTHLGCTVNWRPVPVPEYPTGIISCPCHGSIYDKSGNVISGPAPRALDRYDMKLKNNILVVDTAKIIDTNEKFLTV